MSLLYDVKFYKTLKRAEQSKTNHTYRLLEDVQQHLDVRLQSPRKQKRNDSIQRYGVVRGDQGRSGKVRQAHYSDEGMRDRMFRTGHECAEFVLESRRVLRRY